MNFAFACHVVAVVLFVIAALMFFAIIGAAPTTPLGLLAIGLACFAASFFPWPARRVIP